MSSTSASERVLHAFDRLKTVDRARAIAAVIEDSRCDHAMAEWGLDAATSVFDRASVSGISRDIDGVRVAVSLAESVATAPLRSMALPFLRGARSVLARAPSAQRAVARLWAELLIESDLDCVCDDVRDAPQWLDETMRRGVDLVIAFGSDERVERVRSQVSAAGGSFEGYGHGAGVAWIDARASDESLVQTAWDFCAYDGVGCLSPELLWVSGDSAEVLATAERLASAMARWSTTHPRGARSPEERVFERNWRSSTAAAVEWFSRGEWGSVAVVDDRAASLVRPMGARNVLLRAAGDGDTTALDWLRANARWLTTVGVDDATRARVELVRSEQSTVFFARIAALGAMQRPPLDGEADPRWARAQRAP